MADLSRRRLSSWVQQLFWDAFIVSYWISRWLVCISFYKDCLVSFTCLISQEDKGKFLNSGRWFEYITTYKLQNISLQILQSFTKPSFMSPQDRTKISATQDIRTIRNFLKLQSPQKVQECKQAFNNKIIQQTQKLTQTDKGLLYQCLAKTLFISLGLGLAFRVLNAKKLRAFPGFKWILGVGGVYVIGKSIYELPYRMAFAQYIQKEEDKQQGGAQGQIGT